MANRSRVFKPFYIVAQSSGATFNGPWLNIEGLDDLSFQVKWTGTTAGALTVEGSNDAQAIDSSTRAPGPSGTMGGSTIATNASGDPGGGVGNIIMSLNHRAERWVRLVFTRSGGTGAISCAFAGKGI